MQSLSSAITPSTAVQNPSMSEIHVVKTRHKKMGPATEDRISGCPGQDKCKSCYCCGATQSHKRKTDEPRMLTATSVERRDMSRVAASPKK